MADLHAALSTVWSKSWHGHLGAQAPPPVDTLIRWAGQGWVRSYVLFADAEPVACVQGYQYTGTFYDEAPAYDVGWKQYSPGLVLDYLMLQDLFVNDPPRVVDFGFGYNQYKEMLGTRREERCQLWIPITPRGHAILAGLRCCDLAFRAGKKVLGKGELSKKLKVRVRGR